MLEQLANLHPVLPAVAGCVVLLVAAVLADLAAKQLLLVIVRAAVRRTALRWDDVLVEHKVFTRLAQIVPAVVIYSGIGIVPDIPDTAEQVVRNVASAYMVVMIVLTVSATLTAANRIYETMPSAQRRPIKGFVQLAQIAV